MRNRHFILLFCLLVSLPVYSQVIEKSYLSTDKEIYAPEDTIWFKAYAFDLNSLLSAESVAYHVLVLGSDSEKLTQSSWPVYDGLASGYLIAPKLEGTYKIVAISGQMVNSSVDQAFNKTFFVRSELADEIDILAYPQFEVFNTDADNAIDIFTQFSPTKLAPDVRLTYQIFSEGKRVDRGRFKTAEDGKVTLKIGNLKGLGKDLSLLIESEDKILSRPIKLSVPIPVAQQYIDLQFLPEGGTLVNGKVNKIAFKALDKNGEPFDFKGLVISSSGKIVAAAESYYKGMGSFNLLPQAGETYTFQVNSPFKIDSLYAMPKASNIGVSLSISDPQKDGKQYAIVRASDDIIGESGKFIISKNNEQISTIDFKFSKQENWELAFENLGVGVYSLLVTDQNNTPIAERLFFANVQQQLKVDVKTDQENYKARDKTAVAITITDQQGNPVQGNFSIAALDEVRSKSPAGEQPNLLGQILLASELKGNVPTPNFYFTKEEKARTALDLVMMTNGWRKYKASQYNDPEQLFGRVVYHNFEKRPLKNREIFMTPSKGGNIETFLTNENGEFQINSTYLKNQGDSFLVFSNVKNKNDKPGLSFNDERRIEKIKFIDQLTQHHQIKNQQLSLFSRENKLKPDRFQNTILLNSVTVESNRNTSSFIGNCPLDESYFEYPWTTKKIEDMDTKNKDILALIKQVSPGIKGYDSKYTYDDWQSPKSPSWPETLYLDVIVGELANGRTVPFQIYLNCKPVMYRDFFYDILTGIMDYGDFSAKAYIEGIDIDYVESISINHNYIEAPFGNDFNLNFERIEWPIIQINTLNDILVYKPVSRTNLTHIAFKNYTKEFYAPVYATEKQRKDPVPDLRTTIFWQANVFTNENGQATISYYNADRPNPIKITVEGVDAFSRLGFGTTSYQVFEGPQIEDNN